MEVNALHPNYVRGYNAEKRLESELKKEGYFIQRSHGSKGVFDLIAVHPEKGVKLIQCKRSKSRIVKTQSLINQNQKDIDRMLECKTDKYELVSRELWTWFDPVSGSRTGTWRVLIIRNDGVWESEL